MSLKKEAYTRDLLFSSLHLIDFSDQLSLYFFDFCKVHAGDVATFQFIVQPACVL